MHGCREPKSTLRNILQTQLNGILSFSSFPVFIMWLNMNQSKDKVSCYATSIDVCREDCSASTNNGLTVHLT